MLGFSLTFSLSFYQVGNSFVKLPKLHFGDKIKEIILILKSKIQM